MVDQQHAEHLASLFERVRSLYLSPAFAELMHLDLSFSHMKALRHIACHGAVPMKELADTLCMTPPSVTAMVRRLEQIGLLERVRSTSDNRVWLLHLTDQGRALIETLRWQRITLMQQLIDTLSPAEQHTLLDLLERAVTAAEQLINQKSEVTSRKSPGNHQESRVSE